jgi:hypothetical protein
MNADGSGRSLFSDPASAPAAGEPKKPYAWGQWLAGFVMALGLGAVGDVLAIVLSSFIHSFWPGLILGLCPAVILVVISRRVDPALASGIITGACLVALVGGACGAIMGAV